MELCNQCGKHLEKGKVFKIIDVKNNKMINEVLWCEQCGLTYVPDVVKQKSLPKPEIIVITTPKQLMSVLLGKSIKNKLPNKKTCSMCGITESEILKHSRFGCPNCYKDFEETFLAASIQCQGGSTHHVGKQPKAIVQKNIASLQLKMREAIKEENYEEAARIRDRIKFLEFPSQD